MLLLFLLIYFYILIINVILYKALERLRLDNILFNESKSQLRTTISCINDHWFIVERNSRYLDLRALFRDNDYLPCSINPLPSDTLISCGISGKLNNRSEYCSQAFLQLMFSLH